LYRSPANMFVAEFIGSPAMNLFSLPVANHSVALGDWPIQVPREIADAAGEIVVGIRPEHFEIGAGGVEMQIDVVEELGADAYLYGRVAGPDNTFGHPVVARADGLNPPLRGDRVRLHPQPGHLHFFAADGRRLP
jgi:multiple sugar transport system ATP-binding protein